MKIEAGKSYVDGNGSRVRVVCLDAVSRLDQPVLGLRMFDDGIEHAEFYESNGAYLRTGTSSDYDLVGEWTPKIELGKSYQTKSGTPVRILCVDAVPLTPRAWQNYPVIALFKGLTRRYDSAGKAWSGGVGVSGDDACMDLMEVKP